MEKELMKAVLQKVQTELQKEFDKTLKQTKEYEQNNPHINKANDGHLSTMHGKMLGLIFSMNMIHEMAKDLKAGKPISEWGKRDDKGHTQGDDGKGTDEGSDEKDTGQHSERV